jgi:mannose-1-phosphate guanylyltransferase
MLSFLIMAGGIGERFWPLSSPQRPKQLLSVFTDKPLIRKTFERILPLTSRDKIFISTNEIQVKALKEILPEVDDEHIIIEPLFKDTAPAIGYGSLMISKYFMDSTICVLASDHIIRDEREFRKVVKIAEKEAQNNNIVTLGIKPTYPETGYGYIKVENPSLDKPTKCLGFKEKPNMDLALDYLSSGHYLWNSGMFVFKFNTIKKAFQKYSPLSAEVLKSIDLIITKNYGIKTSQLVKDEFERFEKKSIDFAIMEKADNIMVIPSSFGWNDVGSFKAFDDLYKKDGEGNVILDSPVVSFDSNDNIIIGSKNNLNVCLLGISNKVIVYTDKEILISEKSRVQEIKNLLVKMNIKNGK